jgi:hypothetical protein
MFSNRLAFAGLAVACVTAAAGRCLAAADRSQRHHLGAPAGAAGAVSPPQAAVKPAVISESSHSNPKHPLPKAPASQGRALVSLCRFGP